MIAGPSSPGVGAPVYQPAGKPTGGTSIVPSAFNPSAISLESTPIAGICRRTGVDFDKCGAWTTSGATTGGGTALGTTTLGATLVGAPSDGAGAAPGSLEQPTAPTAMRATASKVAVERIRRELGLPMRWRVSCVPLGVLATAPHGEDCRTAEPGDRQSASHDIRHVGDGSAGTAVTGGNRSRRRGRDLGRRAHRPRDGVVDQRDDCAQGQHAALDCHAGVQGDFR